MNYINENKLNLVVEDAINEFTKKQVKHSLKSFTDKIKEKMKEKSEDEDGKEGDEDKKYGPKDIRKNARKKKGGTRGDFNAKADKLYNQEVDDLEQGQLSSILTNGPFNISQIAQEVFPDHTKEGAQSQLRKELKGEHADSGHKYRLKKHHLQRLRAVLAKILNI